MNPYILMLEADPDDRYITTETLAHLGIAIPIAYCHSSIDLFRTLAPDRKPALLLLTFNSQPEDAPAILKKLKADSNYADIPVVVLSDSSQAQYREACYRSGASAFIRKPDTVAATNQKIATFFKYWLEVVEI